ncbi:hypothetical protein [Amphibacillus sediminis]|uniref:hypothetical protein n=1 Tax=Amphibacillus sediminis TaxID=360185 RepID=UPI00082C9FE0|nr:hypothetical protein [Amphibacillus sediminis]
MKKLCQSIAIILLLIVAWAVNLFGLMRLIPLFITLPLLFITIYFTLTVLFYRQMFRGFK